MLRGNKMRAIGLTAILLATGVGACGLDATGRGTPTVEEMDVPASVQDYDPAQSDASDNPLEDGDGACIYNGADLATALFKLINYDIAGDDPDGNLAAQRLPEGGVTVRDVIDAAARSGTAYYKAAFRERYNATSAVRTALFNDLGARIAEVMCVDGEDGMAMLNDFFDQLFSETGGGMNFRLREGDHAAYFGRVAGNDGTERTYGLLLGKLSAGSDQPEVPMALYFTPMENTTDLLGAIEGGGI